MLVRVFSAGIILISAGHAGAEAVIFIVFPGFFLNILQEPLREPCNQREIVAFFSTIPKHLQIQNFQEVL